MIGDVKFGMYSTIPPIAPVEENTRRWNAGSVVLGLEMRTLSAAILEREFGRNPGWLDEISRDRPLSDYEDSGSTVHVWSAATGAEHLRFDMLGRDPHYHYIAPDGTHLKVPYDSVANGPMPVWVTERLECDLPTMLAFAGIEKDHVSIDGTVVAEFVREVLVVERRPAVGPTDAT